MERQLLETVPNFSAGRDLELVEALASCFRAKDGVKLLDYSADKDHNRCVITAIGEPQALKNCVTQAASLAVKRIDLRAHQGQHPRMGAVDVIPFIPLRGCGIETAEKIALETAEYLGRELSLPCYLYERSASLPNRENLAEIRKGEFEGLAEKMALPGWTPDFGPGTPHPSAGAVAIGARMPLIAFNVNLGTQDVAIAKHIAKALRHSSGGLRYVKALGLYLEDKHCAQVSMNLTDYTKTAVYRALEMVRFEAKRFGVTVLSSELIGLVPLLALAESAAYYLQLEELPISQILESHLME